MIKISIITINFNNSAGLERTLESIKNLECPDGIEIESIVIDGASRDNSIDVIKSYATTINYYVSEPDNGIYDAMNKGIKVATGHWLNFMNSGDCFASSNVISEINYSKLLSDRMAKLIYGHKMQNHKIIKCDIIDGVKNGRMPCCHQSIFFKNVGFYYNTSYPIYSDYDYISQYYLTYPEGMRYVDLIVSNTEPGGISARISTQKRVDKFKSVYRNFGMLGLFRSYYCRLIDFF